MKKLTVFTPTYNREKLLLRAYESLLDQTVDDFIWLIVDDGSTDDTEQLAERFIREGRIEVRYIKTENGGKMRAHNRGVAECETEFFLCLDSDDKLVKSAVEDILKACSLMSGRNGIAGIIAHKGKSANELLSGTKFPYLHETRLFDLYLKGFKGETTLVFRTEILKKYPFPEIEGEKYVPEDYIYDKIDAEYKYLILDEIITVCEIVDSGYTDSVKRLKEENPKAWFLYYEQRAHITPFSILKIKYYGFYARYAKVTGNEMTGPPLYKMLGLIASRFIR